jgi:hypothetical protein
MFETLSKNVTVPVGMPMREVTVAVKVMDCPRSDGFGDEVSFVDVSNLIKFVSEKFTLVAPRAR